MKNVDKELRTVCDWVSKKNLKNYKVLSKKDFNEGTNNLKI